MNVRESTGSTLVNHWQRGVPVYREPVIETPLLFFGAWALLGSMLALARLFSPLGPFAGMNDAYAWGIWKTFNVMTLTALGSGPLAIGMAAWVFNRTKLHVVMRTALLSGFLFYAAGLLALGGDVGRPWNLWHLILPWNWNAHSAMLEVAVCMPLYCAIFLGFENLPMLLERIYYTGNGRVKTTLRRWGPRLRRVYPYMIVGAYVLPLMHQSSLGGLLLLAGDKIYPLWQGPALPLLYLLAAFVCGSGFVTFVLLIACLRYSRRLDIGVLSELGNVISASCFVFLGVRFADLIVRGQIARAFSFDSMSLLFLLETALILAPAIALRSRKRREIPRHLLILAISACLGGMTFRYIPTTVAFSPAHRAMYFPSTPELLISIGYISLVLATFGVVVKYFAVLPGELSDWNQMSKIFSERYRKLRTNKDTTWLASLLTR
ncbi:MAG TPA: Ni/Fe-hydrogenase cytochrome b subunit [Candidatus Binatia bacterium]|nr:Ni/Fe-hydrogenase cytochrome b subunit [Candidatus Binatia bacterium]